MRCIREGTMYKQTDDTKRCYYLNVGQIIGASKGRETSYVYAEFLRTGQVHGRPITDAELRQKGVRL